jgi:hypothetical protein
VKSFAIFANTKPPRNRKIAQHQNWRVGLTHRAAPGGTPTARELLVGGSGFHVGCSPTLLYGAARQWPFTLWCFVPVG